MYNGIGLQTPRGSGTNGYVQRNLAFVKSKKDRIDYKTEEEINKLDQGLNKQPNREILDHERKRKVELKCMEMQELMEEQGYSDVEVTNKVNMFRKMLMAKEGVSESSSVDKDEHGRPIARATHQLAQANQEKNERLKEAFGLTDYVEGSAFDPDRKAKEEAAKAVALAQKKYSVVQSSDEDESKAESPSSSHKKKKKRSRHDSGSTERSREKRKKSRKHSKKDRSHSKKHRKRKHHSKKRSSEKKHKRHHSSSDSDSHSDSDECDAPTKALPSPTKDNKKAQEEEEKETLAATKNVFKSISQPTIPQPMVAQPTTVSASLPVAAIQEIQAVKTPVITTTPAPLPQAAPKAFAGLDKTLAADVLIKARPASKLLESRSRSRSRSHHNGSHKSSARRSASRSSSSSSSATSRSRRSCSKSRHRSWSRSVSGSKSPAHSPHHRHSPSRERGSRGRHYSSDSDHESGGGSRHHHHHRRPKHHSRSSRSPSIRRRRGSPSHLDKRRITSRRSRRSLSPPARYSRRYRSSHSSSYSRSRSRSLTPPRRQRSYY